MIMGLVCSQRPHLIDDWESHQLGKGLIQAKFHKDQRSYMGTNVPIAFPAEFITKRLSVEPLEPERWSPAHCSLVCLKENSA